MAQFPTPARRSANRGCPIKERERADRPAPYLISAHGLLRIKFGLSQDWRRKIKCEVDRTAHAWSSRGQVSYPTAPLQISLLQKKSKWPEKERANDFSLSQYEGAQNIDKRMRKVTSTRSVAATFDGGLPPPSPYRCRFFTAKKRQGKCRKVGQNAKRGKEGRQ